MELVVIIALTLLLVPLVALTAGALRIVLGILFLLFFPGYSLLAALFPRKDSLDAVERLALSFVLSIAVVPLIGLILNYTPWEIRLYPIVVSVASFIVITSAIALYRRRRLPQEQRFEPRLHIKIALPQWKQKVKLDKALSVILVLSILGAVGTLSYVITRPKAEERFTEFYILGSQGTAEHYPSQLVLGESAEVIVRIVNREHEGTSYRLEIRINGEKTQETGPYSLAHNGIWEQHVVIVPSKAGQDQKVEFQLYKGDASEPYLTLHLWLDVEERK